MHVRLPPRGTRLGSASALRRSVAPSLRQMPYTRQLCVTTSKSVIVNRTSVRRTVRLVLHDILHFTLNCFSRIHFYCNWKLRVKKSSFQCSSLRKNKPIDSVAFATRRVVFHIHIDCTHESGCLTGRGRNFSVGSTHRIDLRKQHVSE